MSLGRVRNQFNNFHRFKIKDLLSNFSQEPILYSSFWYLCNNLFFVCCYEGSIIWLWHFSWFLCKMKVRSFYLLEYYYQISFLNITKHTCLRFSENLSYSKKIGNVEIYLFYTIPCWFKCEWFLSPSNFQCLFHGIAEVKLQIFCSKFVAFNPANIFIVWWWIIIHS